MIMEFRKIYDIVKEIGKEVNSSSIESDIFWIYDNICIELGANKDDKFFMTKGNVAPYEEMLKAWNNSMKVMGDDENRSARNVHFILLSAYSCLGAGGIENDEEVEEYANAGAGYSDEELISNIREMIGGGNDSEDEPVEEIEEEPEETSDSEDGIDEELLNEFIYPTVNEIMSIYEDLIAPCFESTPYGVLTVSGVWTYNSKTGELVERQQAYIKRLYALVNNSIAKGAIAIGEGNRIQGNMITPEGTLIKNYVPKFFAQICYGLLEKQDGTFRREANWGKYKVKLREMLIKMISKVVDSAGTDNIVEVQSAIKELFTNCIIISKFDRAREIRIKYKFDTISDMYKLGRALDLNSKVLFGVGDGVGKLVADEKESGNIGSILYVFDKKLFTGDILFAYRAFEDKLKSGGTINEMNVLLGQKLNGKNEVINMGSPQNISTVLMAGSGSGKGVLTLNVLATLATSGCPFAYLDFKPDMAGALWELERETGAKILAIDSLEGRTARGSEPVRKYDFGMNAPESGVGLEIAQFAIVPYLKLMQLSCLLASYRASGKMAKGKKVFFILDEAQGCNAVYAKMIGRLNDFIKENKKGNAEDLEYAKHMLAAYGEQLTNDMENVINTTGRTGLIGYFTIGQDCDPDNWKDGIHPWGKSLFGVMVGKCHTKFIGKNGGKSPTYSATGMKDGGGLEYVTGKGDEEGKLGYFVTAHGANCKDATASVFKSYLVLNDADYEKDPENGYAASLLKNVQDPVLREKIINEDFYNNGKLNDRVGFRGLMKYIAQNCSGVDLNEAMSSGYNLIWQAMELCGLANRYSCIEEYLFDCSRGSIFTLSELKSGVSVSKDENSGFSEKSGDNEIDADGESILDEETPYNGGRDSDNSSNGFTTSQNMGGYTRGESENWGRPQPLEPPINSRSNYNSSNCYSENLNIDENPYNTMGENPSPVQMMSSLSQMSKIVEKCIERVVGSFSRVNSFCITYDETIVVNGIAVKPRLPESVIKTLPFDVRDRASRGCYADMLKMNVLYKFQNLKTLEIEDVNYAETRVKDELGIGRKGWDSIFKKLKTLQALKIGGTVIRPGDDESKYKESDNYKGFALTEKLRKKMHMPSISVSGIGRMYKSKKVPTVVKVAGTVAGIGGMLWVASVLGIFALPVGLIVGNKVIKK